MEDVFSETWGQLSREELAEMRANAKACLICGMLATVDPILHESRYGHAPVITGTTGRKAWSARTLSWVPQTGPEA